MMANTSGYLFETKSPDELTDGDIAAWDLLLDASKDHDSAFYSSAWARACAAAGFDVRVTLARGEGGELVGAFAFQKCSGIAGLIGLGERPGGAMSDYFAPIIAQPDTAKLSPQDMFGASGLSRIDLSHVPARATGRGEDLIADESGPVTRMGDGFETWWERFGEEKKSRATDLGRRTRKIEREYGDLRLVLDAVKTADLLDSVIDEKRRQYSARGASDVFDIAANRALLHALLQEDDPRCQLVISTLHAGETWAASHIGLRCHSVLHYWFPVYNEDLKRSSPGRLLILEMLRAMPDAGLDLLDYGLGEGRTKLEFSNGLRPFVKGSWRTPGPRGLAAQGFQSVKWRLGKA
jgi:CelD/BcsL family acetyltransferase involved in cellulose biosynthesis